MNGTLIFVPKLLCRATVQLLVLGVSISISQTFGFTQLDVPLSWPPMNDSMTICSEPNIESVSRVSGGATLGDFFWWFLVTIEWANRFYKPTSVAPDRGGHDLVCVWPRTRFMARVDMRSINFYFPGKVSARKHVHFGMVEGICKCFWGPTSLQRCPVAASFVPKGSNLPRSAQCC